MEAIGTPLKEWDVKITGESLKYICAILNSTLPTWFMRSAALNSGMGTTRWISTTTFERTPIPKISPGEQEPFIRRGDKIQAANSADPDADVAGWESDINDLVYDLYGLTETEIDEIEGSLDPVPLTAVQQDALLKIMLEGR